MKRASENGKFPKLKSWRLRSMYSAVEFICIPQTLLWAKQEDVQYVIIEVEKLISHTWSLKIFITSTKKSYFPYRYASSLTFSKTHKIIHRQGVSYEVFNAGLNAFTSRFNLLVVGGRLLNNLIPV
jgi:hypothetical protein